MTPARLAEIRGIHARLTSPDHCVTTAQASAAVADLITALDAHRAAVEVAAKSLGLVAMTDYQMYGSGCSTSMEFVDEEVLANPILAAAIKDQQEKTR